MLGFELESFTNHHLVRTQAMQYTSADCNLAERVKDLYRLIDFPNLLLFIYNHIQTLI